MDSFEQRIPIVGLMLCTVMAAIGPTLCSADADDEITKVVAEAS